MRVDVLEDDYAQHRRYMMGLRRLKKKKIPIHGGKTGHLPPLDEDSQMKESKIVSQSMDNKALENLVENE